MGFTHPTLHMIDANSMRVIGTEVFAENRWYGEHEVIARGGRRYRIVKQQTDVHHYYIWVESQE